MVVVSQHALQVSRSTPRGEVEGDLAGGVSRPTAKGRLRGIWPGGVSRPTPKGEVEGDLARGGLQAHTRGGLSQHALRQTPPTATAAGGTHPTGMHSC